VSESGIHAYLHHMMFGKLATQNCTWVSNSKHHVYITQIFCCLYNWRNDIWPVKSINHSNSYRSCDSQQTNQF